MESYMLSLVIPAYKREKTIVKNLKVFGYKRNQGKGYAVRLGIIKAQGDIIGFMDAGLDINPSSIIILLDFMNLHDADIVIGSKLHPDSMINYPWGRKILSWGYRTLVHFLFDV